MFWTIVGALVFVFFIAPLIFQLVVGIIGALFDGNETVGCIGLVVVLLILLAIIF